MNETEIKVGQKYTWLDNHYANGARGEQIRITGKNGLGRWTYDYVTNTNIYRNDAGFVGTDENFLLGATLIEDSESDFYVGRKVRITDDISSHGFPVGTEVFLVGNRDDSDVWLASEDQNAAPRWTGRLFASKSDSIVMNVDESDMEAVEKPLADWEKELFTADSTGLAKPAWSEVTVGSKVTIRYTPTGEEFTTTAHEGEYGDLSVLGWSIYTHEVVDAPDDIELLRVEQPKPVLPTTNGSRIRSARGYNQAKAVRINGEWIMVNSGVTADPETWVDGWVLVEDAGVSDD